MSEEKNPSLLDLLEELLALPADQREQRLQPLAPEQRELLRKWLGGESDDASKLIPSQQSLLRALNQAINAGAGSTLPMAESPGGHLAPTVVGPYHILQKLGEGGMGTVYKAEQRTPIRRIVAIKLIKPGFDTQEVIARFDSERQALARIDHPNIAKVLEAGADEQGRPYFAMEYVPGVPITRFADENRLSIQERLKLFLQVCDAINYSHTKAIIHRDIKSSNVLAYLKEGKPTVKVIDFGIAKALTGDRLTDRTFNTGDGSVIGSYDSMSPEQASGSPDIDTRTDVYSLGALLYELLTGVKPFEPSSLQTAADAEIRRMIREVEPSRPSTRLTGMGETATKIAQSRQAKVDVLARQLRDELEWIPLKAMRKERQRRYASPLQLAEDVQNYLDQKPLLAGPETKAYLVKKYLHRHRVPVAIGITIASLLVGGIVGISLLYARAENLRHRSDAATVLAREANREADHQAARADAELHEFRQQIVQRWSVLGINYEQRSESALAMLSFAKALEYSESDPELARIPRIQLNLLAGFERWPEVQLRDRPILGGLVDASFSPQGQYLICVGMFQIAVREFSTGRRVATFRATSDTTYISAALSPDQSLLAAIGGSDVLPPKDGWVALYDAYTQRELRRRKFTFPPTHVTFSADGRYVLVEGAKPAPTLDISSFDEVAVSAAEHWLSPEPDRPHFQAKFDELFRSFDSNERDAQAVVSFNSGIIKLFDTRLSINGEPICLASMHDSDTTVVRFSPDGHSVVSFDDLGTPSIWPIAIAAKSSIDQLLPSHLDARAPDVRPALHGWPDEELYVSSDGQWLVHVQGRGFENADLTMLPAADLAKAKTVSLSLDSDMRLKFHQSNSWFNSPPPLSADGKIMALPWGGGCAICNTHTGAILTLGAGGDVGISRDGTLATTIDFPDGISQWNATNGKLLRGPFGGRQPFGVPHGGYYTVGGERISPDARWAIASDPDSNGLRVWDVSVGKQTCTILNPGNDTRCLWTADNLLLTGGTGQAKANWRMWDPATGTCLANFGQLPFASYCGWLDPTRKVLAAAGNGKIQVFDLVKRRLIGRDMPFVADQQSKAILDLDGQILCVVRRLNPGRQDEIDIYDVPSGQVLAAHIPMDGKVIGAVFPEPGKCLIATTRIFNNEGLLRLDYFESSRSAAQWKSLAEIYSNSRFDEADVAEPLTARERSKTWLLANVPEVRTDFVDAVDITQMSIKASAKQHDGHLDEASVLAAEALRQSKRLFLRGDARIIGYESDYADVLVAQNKFSEAEAVLLDGLSAAREVQDRGLQIKTHELLADIYRTWGKVDLALEQAEKAKSLRPSTQPTVRAASTSSAKK